jgi:hypothetical protein
MYYNTRDSWGEQVLHWSEESNSGLGLHTEYEKCLGEMFSGSAWNLKYSCFLLVTKGKALQGYF